MLNKTDFELKEIKTDNSHMDYYFVCSDNAQEEFKNYYDNILIQKIIFSVDENIIIMECNDNGYIYNTLCNNDQLVKILIRIFNNFDSIKKQNKKAIEKAIDSMKYLSSACETAIDSMKYLSSACETAFKNEYTTWKDDYNAVWKDNQTFLEKYISETTIPFYKLIKTPP